MEERKAQTVTYHHVSDCSKFKIDSKDLTLKSDLVLLFTCISILVGCCYHFSPSAMQEMIKPTHLPSLMMAFQMILCMYRNRALIYIHLPILPLLQFIIIM